MEEALIAGGVAVVLWVLSRVPGFTAVGRIAASVQRDLQIVEKLPAGAARRRLTSSVEKRVLEMLILRGEGSEAEEEPLRIQFAIRRYRRLSLTLSAASVVAAAVAVVPLINVLRESSPQFELSAENVATAALLVGAVVAAGSSLWTLARVWRRARLDDLRRRRRRR